MSLLWLAPGALGGLVVDSGQDGVIDQWDNRPETPSDSYVDRQG